MLFYMVVSVYLLYSLNLILVPVPYATPKWPIIVRATELHLQHLVVLLEYSFKLHSIRYCAWFLLCQHWWLDKGLSRVFKGQTGFEFWVLCFRFLCSSFSSFGCFVFESWVLRFRVLGALFSSLGCFIFQFWVLRFRVLGASFSSLGWFVFEFWVLRFRV